MNNNFTNPTVFVVKAYIDWFYHNNLEPNLVFDASNYSIEQLAMMEVAQAENNSCDTPFISINLSKEKVIGVKMLDNKIVFEYRTSDDKTDIEIADESFHGLFATEFPDNIMSLAI